MREIVNKIAFFVSGLVLCLIIFYPVSAQTTVTRLVLNSPVTSEIKGGETQNFSVSLLSGQTARVEIVQNGVDVSLAAFNTNGEKFIETETPSGLLGNDLILVTATETGEYRISVTPANPRAKAGSYTIALKQTRPSVPEDFEINKAAKEITKIADAAIAARNKGTLAGRLEALEKFRQVVELSKIKKDLVWEGLGYLYLGLVSEHSGELQKALDYYLKGLETFQKIGNREFEASSINNIGSVYSDLGEYEKAISYYTQAIRIQRKIGNRKSVGIYLNNIGNAYKLLRNYEQAEEFLRKSLAIKREDESIRGKRSVAITLNNLGVVLVEQDRFEDGLDYLLQALDLRRKIKHRWGIANSLVNLGNAQLDAGRKQESFENLAQGNLRANEVGDRQLEARSFYLLAIAEKDRGNLTEAIENVSKGLDLIEQIRGELVSSEIRYTYFASVQNYYELYTDLLVSRFEKTKNRDDLALALQISERSRSRSLIELLQEAKVDFKQGNNPKLIEKLKELQTEINGKYKTRQRILSGKSNPEQVTKINNEINDLNSTIQNLKIKIRRENPKYADLTEGKTISVNEIQALLGKETVLLEYKLGEKRSFIWLVTNKSIEIFNLPPRKEIEKKARVFYDLVAANQRSQKAKMSSLSNELSEVLLSSFSSKIANKRLAIVADGVLQYIPFSAIRDPGSEKLLAETNEILVLPSASVLAQLRGNPNLNKSNKKTIAIFADPVFDLEDSRIAKNSNFKPDGKNIAIKEVLRDFRFGETLPRLLASRQEARNILKLVDKDQANVSMDFAANLESIENSNLKDYRILHFATHGLLNSSHPELSGLVFSLYDKKGRPQDGFLSLNSIYNLDLSSDLIVLSACQTALGKDIRGEGLVGMSRGFLYAGSNRIIASLWKVDDAATAEFMKRFYQNHLQKRLSVSAALRQTKIEMQKIPRYRSPYYWSAFTLLGDWK